MEDRSLPRPVLRPLKVEARTAETQRYGWVARPSYRAQILLDAIDRRSQQKKKPY